MNLLEALARQVTDPSLPGPMGALPRPLRVAAGLLPATRVTQLLPALMGADQGAARALTGGGIAGMALLNRAGLMHTTRANQADLANLLAAFQAAQGNPYERAQATNDAFAGEHGGVQSGILNTATDPLNMVGPAGKLAEAAQLHRLAQVLDAVNTVQNVPGEAVAQVGRRALRPILQAPAVRDALGGLGDRLAQAVGRDTSNRFDTSAISKLGDATGKVGVRLPKATAAAPTSPPVQPLNDLLGAARQTAQPNALEQLTGAGQRVAARDVTPLRSIAQIEAAIPKLPQTAATAARPLDLLPREAVTPVEEAVARATDYGPASGLADLNPVPSAPPDFPTLTGDRREILKRLSPGDLRKLVSTAYNDVPKAISNAFNARPDPVDLAERSIERITTNDKLAARLQQRDPHLAALLGALPDPEVATSAIAEPLAGTVKNITTPAPMANVDIPAASMAPALPTWEEFQAQAGGATRYVNGRSVSADPGAIYGQYQQLVDEAYRAGQAIPPRDLPDRLTPFAAYAEREYGPNAPADMLAMLRRQHAGGIVEDATAGKLIAPENLQAYAGEIESARLNQQYQALSDQARKAEDELRFGKKGTPPTGKKAADLQALATDLRAQVDAVGKQINAAKPSMGGDMAAGGGMGLTPGGLGLLPDAATRALIGAGGGGLLGAASGAASGYTQGDRGATLLRDATAGGAVGVGIGGGAGAAFPQLERALVAGAGKAAGALTDTVLDPETLKVAHTLAAQAWQDSKGAKGVRAGEFVKSFNDLWRSQVTATGRNLGQDAANIRLLVHEFGPEFGNATQGDVKATFAQLRDNALNPDKVARYGDLGAFLQDTGLDHLINDKEGLGPLYGVSMMNEAGSHTGQATLLQRAGIGTLTGAANAATRISPASLLTGGVRAAADPYIGTFFRTLNGWQHDAPRLTFALKQAAGHDFPVLANSFLGDLAAQGVDVTPLESLAGRFAPDDVKAVVMAQPGRTTLAQQAATEWGVQTEAAVRYRAERIAHLFGDFRDKGAAATLGDKAIQTAGRIYPFSGWSLRYAPVLAEIAARHPGTTATLVAAMARSAASVKAHGEAAYRAGTIPITTETPVLGGPARLFLGGKQGTVRANPLALLTGPFGGEFLAGGDDPGADTTLYQKATRATKPFGLSPTPLIQAAAYVTGQDYSAPGSLSRTAGLEQLPQLLPGALGTTIPGGRALLDAARKQIEPVVADAGIATTGPASASDPVMKRYAELVFATTGKPIGDRSNAAYLEGSSPEAQALHDQALRETVLAGAASNATSLVSPVSASGTGADAEAAQIARQPVLAAQDQVDQLPPVQGALLQQQIDQYKQDHPQSAVYDGTSQRARAELLLADWERQNAMLGFFPDIYNYQRQVAMEQLGLLPPGTLAGKQRALDASGQATALPGVANTLRVTPGLADALRAMNQPRH